MAQLRGAFLEDIDGPKLRQLAAKLFAMAVSGDLEAAKLILFYALGKPRESPNADRLDLDEWAILRDAPSLAAVFYGMTQTADAGVAVEVLRGLLAGDPEALRQQVDGATRVAPELFNRLFKLEAARRAGK
jgi:hypothetical protein